MISVIIPVYNEEGLIGKTVRYLKSVSRHDLIGEIIVVDGGSSDNSVNEANMAGARVIGSPRKGRAAQMNEGARVAEGNILYFVHADSLPPPSFPDDIMEAINEGFSMGCYRLRFDLNHWFLKANAWFTRFNVNAFRYGDQSLFVTKKLFQNVNGFCERHIVMEDHDIIKRLRRHGRFAILQKEITTSARKYITNGVYRTQGTFYLMYLLYNLGYSQERLLRVFRKLVRQDKL
jgi:rSAM/selenodomain-associated transferase 2